MPLTDREYDVVLFGATGFTGRLAAQYLAEHAPQELRWAIAGRDEQKLTRLRETLQGTAAKSRNVGIVRADVGDVRSITALASAARLVASTVGPFLWYGAPLVAACAEHGTDYVDITGEVEFVDRMWLDHHQRAVERGARLVHSCGFDSIPHDLGAWWTLQHLPSGVPISMRGYVRAQGAISSGTYSSAVTALGRRRDRRIIAARRRASEGQLVDRRVGTVELKPHREPVAGRWSVPLPTIDPLVVRRSARALSEYGPDFRYGHFAVVGGLPAVVAGTAGVATLGALAQLPPARAALLRIRTAGAGPSSERRSRSWFQVRFVASAGEEPVVTEVSGADPGYDETAKMLAESAMCLVLDDLPHISGQVTTAQAMGPALVERLRRAGITFACPTVES